MFINRRLASLGCSIGIIVDILHEFGLDRRVLTSFILVLLGGRLVTHPRELNIIFKPQCKENKAANFTTNDGKKRVTGKYTR